MMREVQTAHVYDVSRRAYTGAKLSLQLSSRELIFTNKAVRTFEGNYIIRASQLVLLT